MRKLATIVLSAFIVASGGTQSFSPAAADSPYALQIDADWSSRLLLIRIELDAKKADIRLPAGRLEAERMVERDLPGLVKDAVFSLPVDSYRNVGDTVLDGTVDVNKLLELAASAKRRETSFSRDLSTFIALYELPLLAACSLYVRHSAPTPLPSSMDYRPSKSYTGIIIYARDDLPVRGEGLEARARPILFPRIFDSEMNLLLDRNSIAPDALRTWGPVGYTDEIDAASEDRVGEAPLKIMAEAVFGTNRGDLIIPRSEALKILGRPENCALIAAGRVLIVVGE